MSEPAETPGARLRRERERQGLSLQKAADDLRLDSWVIEALEAGKYERVGPPVYAKGHLKKYALLLGIPQQEILAGYEARSVEAVAPPPPLRRVGSLTTAPLLNRLPWMQIGAAGVFVVVVLLFWWSPWQHRVPASSAPAQASAAGQVTTPSAAPVMQASESPAAPDAPEQRVAAAAPAAAPETPAAPAAQAGSATQAGSAATPGTGHARLRLSFSADSWVDVRDANGRRIFVGNGRANSVKTLAGAAPLRVYLGFASGVQLEINERAVAIVPPFVNGDVARFQAGADGVLRFYSNNTRPRG